MNDKEYMNLFHENIWRVIDKIAADRGISVSMLAKRSGLDSTSLNKSKRFNQYGKKRWPSTESLCKIFKFTNLSFFDFFAYFLKDINKKDSGKLCKYCSKNINDFFEDKRNELLKSKETEIKH